MGAAVYRDYDQEALDLQYDNRRRVARFQAHLDFYARESARAREGLTAELGVAYGRSADERLDIFLPADRVKDASVQMFFHGGYWRALSAEDFSFVASQMVTAGAVSVVVNYALMPGVTMAELVRQCRAALAWTHANIARYGGDASRIFISGHSAGGHIVAMMLAADAPPGTGDASAIVKGAVAISGLFDLEPIRLCYLNETLGLTADEVRPASPLYNPPAHATPLVVCYGGAESEEFARQSATYGAAVEAAGGACEVRAIGNEDHMSIAASLAAADSELTGIILAQMGLR